MGRINVRSKGANGERELADFLYSNLPLIEKPKRNLEQVRSGGGDLIVPPFLFECKRVENLDLQTWWVQAVVAARKEDLIPVVGFRQNRKQWEFLVSASCLHPEIDKGFIRLDSKVFINFAWQCMNM